MSEQPRPVRAWFEYKDARVFSREMQGRAMPGWSDIWESSVHPTGAEGVPSHWYHYDGFEMPGVPTPLRSLRVWQEVTV